MLASTVEIKVRYGDFTTRRRQVTLAEPTAEANIIYWHAGRLALQERLFVRPVRLVGLGVSRFSRPLQLSLL